MAVMFTQAEVAVIEQTIMEWTEDKFCAYYFGVTADGGTTGSMEWHGDIVKWCVQGYMAHKVLELPNGVRFFETALADKLDEVTKELHPEFTELANVNNRLGHAATIELLEYALSQNPVAA